MSAPLTLDLGVVVLNWNGIGDTLACLASLYGEPVLPRWVVLMDNGSSDGSPARAVEWLQAQSALGAVEEPAEGAGVRVFVLAGAAGAPRFVLIENGANLGFAIGNNVGLRWLLARDPRYVMLLNNDTECVRGALAELVRGMEALPQAQALVPQIPYWRTPDVIWNCGGQWEWIGRPRYAYADRPTAELEGVAPFEVGFVTGCALVVRSAWFRTQGLLTERFFFGEEDVDLSWRMRATGAGAMWCWPAAVIRHKVGASVARASGRALLPRAYVHYLNRLIFLRSVHGPGPVWQLQRIAVLAYLARTFTRRFGMGVGESLRALAALARESRQRDGVDAAYFAHVMREKFGAPS